MVLIDQNVVKIPCPLRGFDGCNSGSGKGLSKKYFIAHLGPRHFNSVDLVALHKDRLSRDNCLFSALDSALRLAGTWLCGVCFNTHSFSKNCKHSNGDVVLAPSVGDAAIAYPQARFVGCQHHY